MRVFTAGGLLGTMAAAADGKVNALIGQLGLGCKNRVIEQFDVPNSDITVRLGATLQESLDSGAMTVEDLEQYGASFDWSVSGKSASGYCNVDNSKDSVRPSRRAKSTGHRRENNV